MKTPKRTVGFLTGVLLNMFINWQWLTVPALLLILHFWLKISIWWFVGAISLWAVMIIIVTLILNYGMSYYSVDPERPNKNPYSYKAPKDDKDR